MLCHSRSDDATHPNDRLTALLPVVGGWVPGDPDDAAELGGDDLETSWSPRHSAAKGSQREEGEGRAAALGASGAPGAGGVAGAAGGREPSGAAGASGLDGAFGPDGAAGALGPDGGAGALGPDGGAGALGPDGGAGAFGPAVLSGATGPEVAGGAGGEQGTAPAEQPRPDLPVSSRLTEPLRSRLPGTVRGARVDPGRAGAAALLVVSLVAAGIVAVLALRDRPTEVTPAAVQRGGAPLPGRSASSSSSPSPSSPPAELVVSVAGAVLHPGLVRLPPGSRVDDAVRAAGGLAPGGSVGMLNLARKLVDGEQVVVGAGGGVPGGAGAAGGAGTGAAAGRSAAGPLDLNAATAEQLDSLPGVGPVLAERIVEWRTEHGRFASVDQLREVPGIGESKYASLKNKVVV